MLALFSSNLEQVTLSTLLRPLLLSIGLGSLILLLARIMVGDWEKAGLAATWLVLLFFSYGHLYSNTKQIQLLDQYIIRHRSFAPIWAVLGFGGILFAIRSGERLRSLTSILNFIGLIAIILPIMQMGSHYAREQSTGRRPEVGEVILPEGKLIVTEGEQPPDIYYIILDGYARQDTLRNYFEYDNSMFIKELERMGFYIADCSTSNYSLTITSLPASLNFSYLDETFNSDLTYLIKQSAVRVLLKDLGYSDITFETGFAPTEMRDSDFYLDPGDKTLDRLGIMNGVTAFEGMLLRSTAIVILVDGLQVMQRSNQLQPNLPYSSVEQHRVRVLNTLAELSRVPSLPGPKFVFAHIVSPHFPYVFDAEGEPIESPHRTDREEEQRYIEQLRYLNTQVLGAIEDIIKSSATRPIIVIQADHGPAWLKVPEPDYVRILNAYFLPPEGVELLYETVSPVNTFRIVFNAVFGAGLPLLEDKSYISSFDDRFNFSPIEDECASKLSSTPN